MSRGCARLIRGVIILAAWSGAATAQSPQSVTLIPVQPLTFGLLLPGRADNVAVTDIARRAVVALTGSGPVDLTLVLPSRLDASAGMSIPLHFASSDAGLLPTLASPVIAINAFQVNRVQLTPDRAVHLVLGGSAFPASDQRPGHYSARVLVIVSQPGT